jgi:hypothetical protein
MEFSAGVTWTLKSRISLSSVTSRCSSPNAADGRYDVIAVVGAQHQLELQLSFRKGPWIVPQHPVQETEKEHLEHRDKVPECEARQVFSGVPRRQCDESVLIDRCAGSGVLRQSGMSAIHQDLEGLPNKLGVLKEIMHRRQLTLGPLGNQPQLVGDRHNASSRGRIQEVLHPLRIGPFANIQPRYRRLPVYGYRMMIDPVRNGVLLKNGAHSFNLAQRQLLSGS